MFGDRRTHHIFQMGEGRLADINSFGIDHRTARFCFRQRGINHIIVPTGTRRKIAAPQSIRARQLNKRRDPQRLAWLH